MAGSLTTRELRAGLSETLKRGAYGREFIIVKRKGKRVAAVVPLPDLRMIEEIEDLSNAQIAERALRESGESGGRAVALSDIAADLIG